MGDIRLSVGQVNITDHLLIVFREVQNPTAIVRQLDIFPVPASFNVFETGFNDVVHYIDFRNSPDGIALGTLLSTFVYDVKTQTLLSEMRYYTVDGPGDHDPDNGTNTIVDPYFIGRTVYKVYKEGFRPLVPETEWTHAGDTITLLAGGPFQTDEVIPVEIHFGVDVSGGSSESFPDDVVEITADTAIDTTHYGKLMEANGISSILTISFPDFATIPDRTMFGFTTEKGAQRYLAIEFEAGNYCQVDGQQRPIIWMGKSEQLWLFKKGSYVRVVSWTGDKNRLGEVVKADKAPRNGLAEVGGWMDIPEYPRLYNWYINDLPPDLLGTGTFPSTPAAASRTKFCIDLINNKFWMPDTGGYFDRNTDPDGNVDTDRPAGDRKSGTNQGDAINPAGISIENMSRRGNPDGNGDRTNSPNYFIDKSRDIPANYTPLQLTSSVGATETRAKNVNRNAYRII